MSEDESDPETVDSEEPDIEALRLTLKESRRVMDHQIDLFDEIDDKAMRSVRTAVIVVGFIVSALGIAGPDAATNVGRYALSFGVLGVFSLLTTVFAGIGTYVVSDVPYGIGRSYREDVRDGGYTEKEWVEKLLDGYDEWTQELEEEENRNRRYLDVTQFSLFLGVALLAISSGTVVLQSVFGFSSIAAAGVVTAILSLLALSLLISEKTR
ncbi:hypothetical protein [Halarchaeum salinum]|uniref:Uncharacterized protein n=1 Tax=Halarchaeum salinum TaxID=489912 RepID=A0AAV3S8V3_9EURY